MNDPASPAPESGADSPADIPPEGWKNILLATWKDAGEDNLTLIAAGVAFYAFLAFVPLLTAFVLSYGLFAEPASVVRHMQTLTSIMPENAAEIIGDQLKSMTDSSGTQTGFALLLAMAIALYGASKGAASIITALNIVFEVEESRGFIKRTLIALVMTGGAVIVLFLAIIAVAAMNFAEALLPDLGGVTSYVIKGVFFCTAGAFVVLMLAVVYRYGPNRPEARWRWITPGSALATIVWLAATAGFGVYVSNFGTYNATYGSLGAVIVFLTWLYLTAYIVLLGAELNAIVELKAGSGEAEDEAAPERAPASMHAPAPAPSAGTVAARITFLSLLLALFGGKRRRAGR
ncbi:YihY/virulence factor BrkB family protein [Sphingosinicella terrae]|uniref:YihY/virulence factor BrkB family protein n=1 Tax=Sphingosinicella terrae TaxID=2172047 RepID=UPI0013B41607|nr:YihY/virulence factor BrkB family protein [Sphingosinicella terrae]